MMRGADVDAILTRIADAAAKRRPLPEALAECPATGAREAAAAIARGETLRAALAGLLPPLALDLLAGERPTLERAALLALQEERARRERRRLLTDAIAYPALTFLAAIAALAVAWHATGGAAPWRWSWLWLALPAVAIALLPSAARRAPWLERAAPWLTAWSAHAAACDRYRRAALAARWRLPDADAAALLGTDLHALHGLLGLPGAERHAETLAEHHERAARRASRRAAVTLTVGVYLAAAAVFLAGASGVVGAWVDTMMSATVEAK